MTEVVKGDTPRSPEALIEVQFLVVEVEMWEKLLEDIKESAC